MQERTVTTDATVYQVPRPFVVVATQNPIDLEGTYMLPEAQLDRFLMRLEIGYPSPEAEAQVLRTEKDEATVITLEPVMAGPDLLAMIEYVKTSVEVAPAIENYIVALCAHTRAAPEVRLGVSPGAAWPCCARPVCRPRRRGGPTSPPTTSRPWRSPRSPTG